MCWFCGATFFNIEQHWHRSSTCTQARSEAQYALLVVAESESDAEEPLSTVSNEEGGCLSFPIHTAAGSTMTPLQQLELEHLLHWRKKNSDAAVNEIKEHVIQQTAVMQEQLLHVHTEHIQSILRDVGSEEIYCSGALENMLN